MKIAAQYDEKNRLCFPVTLIDTDGYFTINNTRYELGLNHLENFTAIQRPVLFVEMEHPADMPHKSEEDRRRRYISIDSQNIAGTLELTVLRPNENRAVVKGVYYPKNVSLETIEAFAEGRLSLGIRARVIQTQIVDIITWDLVHTPERVLQHRICEKPPLNTTVFISANRGYTWFPAQFLWIGEKTFVWRNMSSGATIDNEITNDNNHTYFMWAPVPEGVAVKTYNGNNVPESLRKRSDANAD